MKILILIPTLNEEKNIEILYKKIKKNIKNFNILFIDDNSKDSTRSEIKKLKKKNPNIFFIFRNKRYGVGSAHKEGLKFAYKKKYKYVITMDADGTHDPKYINILLNNSKKNNLVATNRFLKKNSLNDWPFNRKLLTTIRYYLINVLLNISYDSSGAFRCYDISKISLKDILKAKHNGYPFFWESIFLLDFKKYSIYEISIKLPFRKVGSSKMRIRDIFNSLLYLFYYFFKKIFKNIK